MRCCICGTVRNCGKYLERLFANMEKMGSLFDEFGIILFYDPSHDDSLEIIQQYQASHTNVFCIVNEKPLHPFRTHRLAYGRNQCLKKMHELYGDYEMFIMLDCDDVNTEKKMNLDVLEKYIKRDDWDSLSFNREDYYDTWALSIAPYYTSFKHFQNRYHIYQSMKHYVSTLLKNTPPGILVPCYSAFNGFAIYKTKAFEHCQYEGHFNLDLFPYDFLIDNLVAVKCKFQFLPRGTESGLEEDCEHRSFHVQAIQKNNARIRISSECLFS